MGAKGGGVGGGQREVTGRKRRGKGSERKREKEDGERKELGKREMKRE